MADDVRQLLLHELFFRTVEKFPDKVAATFSGNTVESVNFCNMGAAVLNLSSCFKKIFCKNEVVGVFSNQNLHLPTVLLAVLESSAAFYTLSTSLDPEKVIENLERHSIRYVLMGSCFVENIINMKSVVEDKTSGTPRLVLFQTEDQELCNLLQKIQFSMFRVVQSDKYVVKWDERLAYVMQTSGTTGESKAVFVPHSCIVPNIIHLSSIFEVTFQDMVLLASPYTFDPFVVQMFLAFYNAATLLIVPDAVKLLPQLLCQKLFDQHRVTILQLTPSFLHYIGPDLIREKMLSETSCLSVLVLGGEACPPLSTLKKWKHSKCQTKLYNIYGITEVSSWATCCRIWDDDLETKRPNHDHLFNQCPLGSPLSLTELSVRDDTGNVLNGDGMGHLWIGGLGRKCMLEGESAEDIPIMRDTGDLVEVKNGQMWYLGRSDNQLKRFGHRVNLDYIEKVVVGATDVLCCKMVQQPAATGTPLIHLFVVPAKDVTSCVEAFKNNLKERLQEILPRASQPDKIHMIFELPLTSHGKVNKNEILRLLDDVDDKFYPVEMPIAKVLSKMWQEFIDNSSDHQGTKLPKKEEEQEGALSTTVETLHEMSRSEISSIHSKETSSNIKETSSVHLEDTSPVNIKDTNFVNLKDINYVNLNDTSSVNLKDTSSVNLKDTSSVNGKDTSSVNCKDTSSVNFKDTSSVNPKDTSSINLKDTSSVNLKDTSSVNPKDTNSVNLKDKSSVNLKDTSSVNLKGTSYVNLKDASSVNLKDTSSVNLNDTSSVNLKDTIFVNPNDMFILQGGDSFAALQLADAIERWSRKRWKTNFDLSLLVDTIVNRTFNELVNYIEEKIQKINPSTELNFPHSGESAKNLESAAKRSKMDVRIKPTTETKGEQCVCFARRGSERFLCLFCRGNSNCLLSYPTISWISCNPQCSSQLNISAKWKTSLGKCIDASPLVVPSCLKKDGAVFIGSHSHLVMSVSLSNGDVLWKTRLGGRVESSSCLSLCGHFIVVGCYDSKIYVLDRSSGSIIWTYQTGDVVKSSPCLDKQTGLVWVGSHDSYLYALDLERKSCKMRVNCIEGSCFSSPSLCYQPHQVYIGTLSGRFLAVDAVTGGVMWCRKLQKPIFASPLVQGDNVYLATVDGSLKCFDHHGNSLWQFWTTGPIFSSPVSLSDGKSGVGEIVVASHDHHIYCVTADGAYKWSFQLDSPVYSTPFVISHNVGPVDAVNLSILDSALGCCRVIFVTTTKGTLYLLDAKDGRVLNTFHFPGEIFSSPIVVDQQVVVGCRDDYLYSVVLT